MPNVKKPAEPESGNKRAADFSQSFLSIPGYADDSMLSTVRYVSKAQSSLRQCDFDEFMAELRKMHEASKLTTEPLEVRNQKVREHRQNAYSKVQEIPQLASDFDNFLTNSRRLQQQQQEAAKSIADSSSD